MKSLSIRQIDSVMCTGEFILKMGAEDLIHYFPYF